MNRPAPEAGLQGFSGFANAWDMDENDHLNVQFFIEWFHQSLEIEAPELGHGLSAALAQGAGLRAVEDRVVFSREIRKAEEVAVDSRVLEVGESHFLLLHVMRNESTGEIAGTDVQKVCLVRDTDFASLPLTAAIREAAGRCVAEPEAGLPLARPVERFEDRIAPGGDNARRIGLFRNGASVVGAHEVDRTGRMRARYAMGRGSDAAGRSWRNIGIPLDELLARDMGTVVLQVVMTHYHAPRLGTPLVTWGGLRELGNKTLHFVQWITDAETGTICTASETVAVQFDHKLRKAVAVSDEQRPRVQARVLKLPERR